MWLWHSSQPRERRRAWKGVGLVVVLLGMLTAAVLGFQKITGASISAHAVQRSLTFVDYTRDVQVVSRLFNYANALQKISESPILGSGQGTELTSYTFDPQLERYETWTSWTLDSLYLTLWMKMGIAGLLIFTLLLLLVTRRALQTFRVSADGRTRAFAGGVTASLVAMAMLGVSDASMVGGRFASIFAVIFGLVMVISADVEEEPGRMERKA